MEQQVRSAIKHLKAKLYMQEVVRSAINHLKAKLYGTRRSAIKHLEAKLHVTQVTSVIKYLKAKKTLCNKQ